MDTSFRLAFGSASCKDNKFCKKPYVVNLCKGINSRLTALKNRSHAQLIKYKEQKEDEEWVDNKLIQFAIYKQEIENNSLLFIAQGFIHTYKWPTYISLKVIGHIAAEGIVIDSHGKVSEATEEQLWPYR